MPRNAAGLTRRSLLAGGAAGAAGLWAGGARAQVTDLRGFDALWRSAEDAISAFFGPVAYERSGIEVDLPVHADVGGSVPLTVKIASGMTEADFPRVVHVLAHGNPTPHVLSAWFSPQCGRAEFSTRIRLEKSQMVTAVAQMSDGTHRRVDREVSVSFGACAQIGAGSNDEVSSFRPQTRVSVPARATPGEIIPIRALISHPMETGLRLDAGNRCANASSRALHARSAARTCFACGCIRPSRPTLISCSMRVPSAAARSFDWYDTADLTFKIGPPSRSRDVKASRSRPTES